MQETPDKQVNKSLDAVKLICAVLIACGSIWASAAFKSQLPPYAAAALPAVGLLLAAVIVLFWSDLGWRLLAYAKASYAELKKVVWPKRPDAVRMTTFVVLFAALFTLFIYGVDSIISLLFNAVLVRG